jgi:hypothetical protein
LRWASPIFKMLFGLVISCRLCSTNWLICMSRFVISPDSGLFYDISNTCYSSHRLEYGNQSGSSNSTRFSIILSTSKVSKKKKAYYTKS